MDLVSGWNNLLAGLPNGIKVMLTIVGAVIVVISILGWLWKRRHGGGGLSGLPLAGLIVGVAIAAPTLVIPALLALAQALVTLIVNIIGWVTGVAS